MNILAIDTSLAICSAAVVSDGELMAEKSINCFKKGARMQQNKRTHSELLMPVVDDVLTATEMDISDIDLFAVVNGPGSFTGVRIGVCAAKAFAQANNKPIVSVSTLQALAYPLKHFDGVVCPMVDARNEQAYYAFFKDGERISEDKAGSITDMLDELKGAENIMFLGDGAAANRDKLSAISGAVFACENMMMPRASSACFIASDLEPQTAEDVLPSYIRPSQAERLKCSK